jgi:hypothetical protein
VSRFSVPLALLALAAGAAAIALGVAVLGERTSLERTDAALAAPVPAAVRVGAGGVGTSLLGTARDRDALAAAVDWVGARTQTVAAQAARSRSRAEAELAPLAAAGPGARRSWASTLIAVLELDQALAGGKAAARHVAAARGALEDAVAADPANEHAKRDLELLLTLQARSPKQQQSQQRQGSRGKPQGLPKAGLAAAGWGW